MRPLSSLLGLQGLGLVAEVTSQGTLRMGGAEARQRPAQLVQGDDVSVLPGHTRVLLGGVACARMRVCERWERGPWTRAALTH